MVHIAHNSTETCTKTAVLLIVLQYGSRQDVLKKHNGNTKKKYRRAAAVQKRGRSHDE
jgi:hypothetical protein